MSIQLALRFDEVPITCETQQRYHSISPCLAGKRSAEEQADALGLSYSTVCRWLRQFREEGMPGLFPATEYPREPQTPEHVIVALLFYKTCAPRASDRELARVLRGHPSPHPERNGQSIAGTLSHLALPRLSTSHSVSSTG
jgi:hypothetical protein